MEPIRLLFGAPLAPFLEQRLLLEPILWLPLERWLLLEPIRLLLELIRLLLELIRLLLELFRLLLELSRLLLERRLLFGAPLAPFWSGGSL